MQHPGTTFRNPWNIARSVMVFAVAYSAAAWIGMYWGTLVEPRVPPVWPAAGMAVALLVLLGPRYVPAVFLCSAIVNWSAAPSVGQVCLIAAGNVVEALIGAWVFRAVDRRVRGGAVPALAMSVAAAAIIAPPAGAALVVLGFRSPGDPGFLAMAASDWVHLCAGNAIGIVLMLPFGLAWLDAPVERHPGDDGPPSAAPSPVGLTLLIAALAAFVLQPIDQTLRLAVLAFATFPLLAWGAFAFGLRGAATVAMLLSALVVGAVVRPAGLDGVAEAHSATVLIQSYIATISLTAVTLASELARRRSSERVASESRGLAERVTRAVPGVVYRWEIGPDDDGTFTFVSGSQVGTILGGSDRTGGELGALWDRMHPDDIARVRPIALAAVAAGQPWLDEFRLSVGNDVYRWIRVHAVPEARQSGGRVVYNGILIDITLERSAVDVEAAQRRVLSAIAEGVSVRDVLAQVVLLCERQVPGARGSALLVDEDGLTLRHGAAPSLSADFVAAVDGMPIATDGGACGAAALTDTTVVVTDIHTDRRMLRWRRLATESGTQAVWSTPFHSTSGGVLGTLALYLVEPRAPTPYELVSLHAMADLAGIVAQRERSEQRLRDAERHMQQAQQMEAVGQLAGGIAHDFNNLLTVILSASHLLLDDMAESSSKADDVRLIRDSAARAGVLTRQLLTFSRRQQWQPAAVDINLVVRRLQPILERLVGASVSVDMALAPDIEPVWIDEAQVEQVIINLVVNARDAMPSGGRLRVESAIVEIVGDAVTDDDRAQAPGRYVQLAIHDTGIGMDEATARRAFEPFFTTKPQGQGTGLGLATAYGVVRRADGQITVRSEIGSGTTLTIQLPIRAPLAAHGSWPL